MLLLTVVKLVKETGNVLNGLSWEVTILYALFFFVQVSTSDTSDCLHRIKLCTVYCVLLTLGS